MISISKAKATLKCPSIRLKVDGAYTLAKKGLTRHTFKMINSGKINTVLLNISQKHSLSHSVFLQTRYKISVLNKIKKHQLTMCLKDVSFILILLKYVWQPGKTHPTCPLV